MFEIVSFVAIDRHNTEYIHVPPYATIQTRTTFEHVLSILPPSVRGEPGLVRLVTAFVGTHMDWLQIRCDLKQLIQHRERDMYFVYYSLTNRLPLSSSLMTASNLYIQKSGTHSRAPNVYTHPLHLSGDVYYTRSGHIGSWSELRCRSRDVEWYGHVICTLPCPEPGMVVVTTRRRTVTWREAGFETVVTVEDVGSGWPTGATVLVIDGAAIPTQPSLYAYPDGRHLSGSMTDTLQRIDRIARQSTMVLYDSATKPMTDQWIVDCMFLLQVTHDGRRFITDSFTHLRSTIIQIAETLFIHGILVPHPVAP